MCSGSSLKYLNINYINIREIDKTIMKYTSVNNYLLILNEQSKEFDIIKRG